MRDHPEPWAGQYIGIPYLDRGRSRAGLDCWGLFCLIQREQFGRNLPAYDGLGYRDFQGSTRELQRRAMAAFMADAAVRKHWREVPADAAEPGDGLLLRIMGHPIHVGVCAGAPWFLHIEEGVDSCVERWDALKWQRRLIGVYRWEGVP